MNNQVLFVVKYMYTLYMYLLQFFDKFTLLAKDIGGEVGKAIGAL